MNNTNSDDPHEVLDMAQSEATVTAAEHGPETAPDDPAIDDTEAKVPIAVKPTRKRNPQRRNTANSSTSLAAPNSISSSRHLSTLKPVGIGLSLQISSLNACQPAGRELDPKKVRLYQEMRELTEPPHPRVIRDADGNYHIGSGHHRIAADLGLGKTETVCDVFEGTAEDAIIVGGEENQGPLPMTNKAKKELFRAILASGGVGKYTIQEMAAMCGVERHTVAAWMKARESGDFIEVAGKMKSQKSSEEKMLDAAKSVLKNVQSYGPDVIAKAVGLMQPYLRDEVLHMLFPGNTVIG